MASLSFLGAAGTVTGSRFLVELNGRRVLVDCGMFQGLKPLRLKNWERFPVEPASIDAVVLTHAHLDHSGYLPALVRDGFAGPVYATRATTELADTLLRDSGHLHEEDAAYANRKRFSKHDPALPLYTEADAVVATRSFRAVKVGDELEVAPGIRAHLAHAGHILGAAIVTLELDTRDPHGVVFSGDLGRADPPLLAEPEPLTNGADALVVESTYGDRDHRPREQALAELGEAISRALGRGGVVLIPAFAVDRTPALLFALRELMQSGAVRQVPVFVDSPMALEGLDVYRRHAQEMDPEVRDLLLAGGDPFDPGSLQTAPTPDDSKAINRIASGAIIISASGMATGGRVLHHLKRRLPERRNLVLLPGFQARGTRGQALASGVRMVKIHGRYVPVEAEVLSIDGFSAHADRNEMLAWLRTAPRAPDAVYVVHGEPEASQALADRIAAELGWPAICPRAGERVLLG